jgi:hypothetical protein
MMVLPEVYQERDILRTNVSLLPPDLKEYLLVSIPALCLRLAYVLYTSRLRSAYVSPALCLCFTNEWICLPVYQRIQSGYLLPARESTRMFRLRSAYVSPSLYLCFACDTPSLYLCFTKEWICLPVYQRINQDICHLPEDQSGYLLVISQWTCLPVYQRINQDICHLPENPIRISATCQRINQNVSPALYLRLAFALLMFHQ